MLQVQRRGVLKNKSIKKDREMKKINWMAGCFVLFAMGSSFVMADETSSGRGPRFGVEGGCNVASLSGQQTPGDVYASRLGFVGGVFVSLPLGTSLSLRPELLFSQ